MRVAPRSLLCYTSNTPREIHLYARNDESELGTDGATQFIETMNRIGCTKEYIY